MSGNDRSFNENLDLLIKLFRRLKDKSSIDEIQGIDKSFYQNFEYLLNNYEMMRDQISEELLDKFGEPVKDMIAGLVEQLKDELGDEFYEIESMEDETILSDEDDDVELSLSETIDEIDKKLRQPGLSEEEINKLLDKRSELMSRK